MQFSQLAPLAVGSFVALVGFGCSRSTTPPIAAKPAGVAPVVAREELLLHRPVKAGDQTLARLELRFIGARHATAKELAMELALPRLGALEPEVLERDDLVLTAWYYDRGYLEIKVTHAVSIEGDKAIVTYRLDEGIAYRVGAMHVAETMNGVKQPPIGWKAPLAVGALFSRIKFVNALAAMRTAYADLGYAYVEADPQTELDRDRRLVTLTIPVRRGVLQSFEAVVVLGNQRISADLVGKQLLVHANDRYSETALLQSKKNLLDTGWFERVDVSTKKGTSPSQTIVTFEVVETKKGAWPLTASNVPPAASTPFTAPTPSSGG